MRTVVATEHAIRSVASATAKRGSLALDVRTSPVQIATVFCTHSTQRMLVMAEVLAMSRPASVLAHSRTTGTPARNPSAQMTALVLEAAMQRLASVHAQRVAMDHHVNSTLAPRTATRPLVVTVID